MKRDDVYKRNQFSPKKYNVYFNGEKIVWRFREKLYGGLENNYYREEILNKTEYYIIFFFLSVLPSFLLPFFLSFFLFFFLL